MGHFFNVINLKAQHILTLRKTFGMTDKICVRDYSYMTTYNVMVCPQSLRSTQKV